MKAKRKSTGTRLRFEVFKRDGFRCVYCGATPMQASLQADHVVPVAEGGETTAENLVTSCATCNAGKSDVPLDRRSLRPVEAERLQAQEDHIEQIRQFLEIQRQIEDERRKAVDLIAEHWETVVGPMSEDMYGRFDALMREWPHDALVKAMGLTARKMGSPGLPFKAYRAEQQAKYFHGILRNWRQGKGL